MPKASGSLKYRRGERYDPATEGQLFKEYEDLYNARSNP